MTAPQLTPDDMATAGEYVLGTLSRAERVAFQARLQTEPALEAEVARWQAQLSALTAEIAPVAPPAELWSRIERQIDGPAADPAAPAAIRAGVSALWRWLALGASGVAAALAVMLYSPDLLRPTPGPDARDPAPAAAQLWVSDLVSEDGQIRLAALYNEANGEMRVSVGGSAPDQGRDFELWLIQGDAAPISLGVMPRQGQAAMPIPEELRALVADATLAITDEPAGGSPQGVATGPIVAAAALRRI